MASPEGASPLPGIRGTRLPARLALSPEPGPSPVSGLCTNMGHLSCVESITPRRRLRLSPDVPTPSPAAPAGTPTPTGGTPEPGHSPRPCSSSSSSEGSCSPTPPHCSLRRSPSPRASAHEEPTREQGKDVPVLRARARLGASFTWAINGPSASRPYALTEWGGHGPDLPPEDEPGDCSPGGETRRGSSGLSPAPAPGTDGESLTGDFSRPCSLPLEEGQHRDLRYVSPATVASLLRGQLAGVTEEYMVVDCRYPYEFAGGHIQGALNLYREEQLARWFLLDPPGTTPGPRSSILIFHCEFSSERGPRLCRSLRRMDRDANQYPELRYPELYVLRGGYKEFYQHFQDLCEPQGYVHMRHKDFRAELRNYQRRKQPWSLRRIRKELFKPLSPGPPFP